MAIKGFRAAITSPAIAGTVTAGSITANATGGCEVRSLDFGCHTTTPVDVVNFWKIDRFTSFGTATSVGASNVVADRFADQGLNNISVRKGHSVEPTYASTPFYDSFLNQRVKEHIELQGGNEWDIPRTASAGMGLSITSTGTATCYICWSWR